MNELHIPDDASLGELLSVLLGHPAANEPKNTPNEAQATKSNDKSADKPNDKPLFTAADAYRLAAHATDVQAHTNEEAERIFEEILKVCREKAEKGNMAIVTTFHSKHTNPLLDEDLLMKRVHELLIERGFSVNVASMDNDHTDYEISINWKHAKN